jgi:malonyl-CoA decarboxylase
MQSGALRDIIGRLLQRRFRPTPKTDGVAIEALCTALLSETGDIATVGIGRQILGRYSAMSAAEKQGFFRYLATDLDVDPASVERLARAYGEERSDVRLRALLHAAEPRRQELLRRLNRVAGATSLLVAMRRDLFAATRDDRDLRRIDLDFAHLLSSWFNPGFLMLTRIGWDSPASILEKIIAYEAVHEIGDWDELRRRVQPDDRRCFAYFHPSMPDEPLIFVEVALATAIPASIQAVLATPRAALAPERATTAVFYSISNCQEGLRGVSFGNSLIKQVVEDLSREFPHLTSFVTLSPIPGFREWLEQQGEQPDGDRRRLAARYLVDAKRADGLPQDSVARFHLANGAIVHDIHIDADRSAKGARQSHGLMVNYLYDRDRLEANIDGYFGKAHIARSPTIADILKA